MEYRGDLNACRSKNGPTLALGGRRRAMVRFVTARQNSMMRAKMRMVHLNLATRFVSNVSCLVESMLAYPTVSMRLWAAIGKTVPPPLDPTATNANARPFRFLNQCETTASVGPKITPHAV